jgi:hypothetical protein
VHPPRPARSHRRCGAAGVLTPPRLLAATARLLARGGCDRRALLGEVGGLIAQDTRRKRAARHPNYVPLEASVDAGATEVEDDDPNDQAIIAPEPRG